MDRYLEMCDAYVSEFKWSLVYHKKISTIVLYGLNLLRNVAATMSWK